MKLQKEEEDKKTCMGHKITLEKLKLKFCYIIYTFNSYEWSVYENGKLKKREIYKEGNWEHENLSVDLEQCTKPYK